MNHTRAVNETVREHGEDTAVVNRTLFNSTQDVYNEEPYLPKEVWIFFIGLFIATLMWTCCRSCLKNFVLRLYNAGAKACSCIICWQKSYSAEVPISSSFGSNTHSPLIIHHIHANPLKHANMI